MPSVDDGDFLALDDDALFAQCRFERFRVSGPGGQHRNKTDSAVRLTHRPTGIVAEASERRSQHQNRVQALRRLRVQIACRRRRPVVIDQYHPPLQLQRILPPGIAAEHSRHDRVGPNHPDFWRGAQALLDLFQAASASLADTAALIGCSTNQLAKLLASSPDLLRAANDMRAQRDLPPVRRSR